MRVDGFRDSAAGVVACVRRRVKRDHTQVVVSEDAEQRARAQLRRCGPNVRRGLAPLCPVLTERKRHELDHRVAQEDVKRARQVEAASCGFLAWLVSYMAACARCVLSAAPRAPDRA